MKDFLLEVCVDSVESALAAVRGGAGRLELCANLIIGGTTPDAALFWEIRKYTDIPVRVLIRPRFGDFCYSEYEFNIIKEDVKLFKSLGAQGVVLGMLTPDGMLDTARMEELMTLAGGMPVTLHRAFDVCADPVAALECAAGLGIDTILTSGQANTCVAGAGLLAQLVKQIQESGTCKGSDGQNKIEIMAGGGVDAAVIRQLHFLTGVKTFHMSGKIVKDSAMVFRKTDVNMGLPAFSEYDIWQTDEDRVRAARQVLEAL